MGRVCFKLQSILGEQSGNELFYLTFVVFHMSKASVLFAKAQIIFLE